ncbi:hypothetical protein QP938_08680 [Porticoccaceae bacterium LTM1]|nr:hypothetical protein QP938_08680 [Porticoccaceae bacterium LTM1]
MNKFVSLFFSLLFSQAILANDLDTVKKDLKRAVPLSNKLEVKTIKETKEGEYAIFSGKYSTPLTDRTGNHIPYKAFYKKGKLYKIEFFDDPSDVVYGKDL